MKEKEEYIECKKCGGTGIEIEYNLECCGFTDEGRCCGGFNEVYTQKQCNDCCATGYIPNL